MHFRPNPRSSLILPPHSLHVTLLGLAPWSPSSLCARRRDEARFSRRCRKPRDRWRSRETSSKYSECFFSMLPSLSMTTTPSPSVCCLSPVIALVSVPLASASFAAADRSVHVSCRRVAVDGGEERRAAHANDMIDERHETLGVVRKQNIARSIGIGIRVLSLPHSKENHS